jgi:uncharacterized protein (DUF433 family)
MSKTIISSNPKIMGGVPCFDGTRIPVSMIIFEFEVLRHTIAEILMEYPTLKVHKKYIRYFRTEGD